MPPRPTKTPRLVAAAFSCGRTRPGATHSASATRSKLANLDDDDLVLELGDLAGDGHVDEAGPVLAVGHDKPAEEGGVNLGLQLDVLLPVISWIFLAIMNCCSFSSFTAEVTVAIWRGARRHAGRAGEGASVFRRASNEERRSVADAVGGGDGRGEGAGAHLGVGGLAGVVLEIRDDVRDVTDALLVDEQVEEVGGEGWKSASLPSLEARPSSLLLHHGFARKTAAEGCSHVAAMVSMSPWTDSGASCRSTPRRGRWRSRSRRRWARGRGRSRQRRRGRVH